MGNKAAKPQFKRGGVSHKACSQKRTAMKERIRVLETEVRILTTLHEAFVQEVRDMLFGSQSGEAAEDAG